MNASTSENGYADAFYDLAKMMDIGARAQSPAEVWHTEMRPRIAALLAKPSVVSGLDRVGLVDQGLDGSNGRIVLDPDQGATRASGGVVKPDLPIGGADHLATARAVDLYGDVVEIGAGHSGTISDAAESHQALSDRDRILVAISGVKQAWSDDLVTSKLDRREIDDLVAAIEIIVRRKGEGGAIPVSHRGSDHE